MSQIQNSHKTDCSATKASHACLNPSDSEGFSCSGPWPEHSSATSGRAWWGPGRSPGEASEGGRSLSPPASDLAQAQNDLPGKGRILSFDSQKGTWSSYLPTGQFAISEQRQATFCGSYEPPLSAENGGPGAEPPGSLETKGAKSTTHEKQTTFQWRKWQKQLAMEFREAGHGYAADSLEECSTKAVVLDSDCRHDNAKVVVDRCRRRYCLIPECISRTTKGLVKRYVEPCKAAIRENRRKGYRAAHIILTTPTGTAAGQEITAENIRGNFLRTDKAFKKVWRNLLKHPGVGIVRAEDTGENGMCHYHIFYYGPYIVRKKLTALWFELTGGKNVKIISAYSRRRRDGSKSTEMDLLYEVIKYMTAPPKVDGDMERYAAVALAAYNRKTIRTYGIFYNMKAPEEVPACCPKCGCDRWISFGRFAVGDEKGEQEAFEAAELHSFNVWQSIKPLERAQAPPGLRSGQLLFSV